MQRQKPAVQIGVVDNWLSEAQPVEAAILEETGQDELVDAETSVDVALIVARLARVRLARIDEEQAGRARHMTSAPVGVGLHAFLDQADHGMLVGVAAISVCLKTRAQYLDTWKVGPDKHFSTISFRSLRHVYADLFQISDQSSRPSALRDFHAR